MTTWTDFLASRGARFDQGGVADFGDPSGELAAAGAATVVADLSHFGLIAFAGEVTSSRRTARRCSGTCRPM